jgi:hypothetical protein
MLNQNLEVGKGGQEDLTYSWYQQSDNKLLVNDIVSKTYRSIFATFI